MSLDFSEEIRILGCREASPRSLPPTLGSSRRGAGVVAADMGDHPPTDGASMRSRGENRKTNPSNTSLPGSSTSTGTGYKPADDAEGKRAMAVKGGVATTNTEEQEPVWYESFLIVVVRLIVYVMMLIVPRWLLFPGETVSTARKQVGSMDAAGDGVQQNIKEARNHFAAVRRLVPLSSRMDHALLLFARVAVFPPLFATHHATSACLDSRGGRFM